MIKKILAAMLALFAAVAFAAVDVNKATQAELEAIKGIGPAIAGKILDERKKSSFKDWGDMVERVKGVGEGNAAKFSAEGLTVNGAAFAGAPAKPATPVAKEVKPMAADKKPADRAAAAPMAATSAAKADAKPAAAAATAAPAATAVDKKAAAMKDKEDKKAAKAAAADEAKRVKADKAAAKKDAKAAKEGKPTAAADAPASAAKK